jgi:polar amino acid transport system substrate-binding protein
MTSLEQIRSGAAVVFGPAGDAGASSDAKRLLAPTGKLRMGLNASNATLVARRPDGSVGGLAPAVGAHIAAQLGVPLETIVYPGSEGYTASFEKDEWDIIVTGRNPFAATKVHLGPDIILTEYVFVARPGFEIASADDFDRVGTRIGVPRNASADAFLRERLKAAELVRTDGTNASAVEMLREGKIDLFGTIASSVALIRDRLTGSRQVPGVFQTVGFAVALPKHRSPSALSALSLIVEEAKRIGIIQRIIQETDAKGAVVAPQA